MDLRTHIKTPAQLEAGIFLIRSNHLFYQPFVLADDVEVGEGLNLYDEYEGVESIHDLNVYAPGHDIGERKQPTDLAIFRKRNEEYRQIYQYIADQICQRHPDIAGLTVGEIGCNTGLNLFNMAVRGAKECYGYDWNDMSPAFNWLNSVLGTNVQFRRGIYDNLYHRFKEFDIPEVDIMINTVFTNHQCDPLQFLCYLCDRARKGVFLWALVHPRLSEACVIYPNLAPHDIMDTQRAFPLYFYNGVVLSEKMLHLALQCLGFEQVEEVQKFVPSGRWDRFQEGFRMYYATRTRDVKSAYWQGAQATVAEAEETEDPVPQAIIA